MRYALRLVDEDSQDAAIAATEKLYVDDLYTLASANSFGDLPHFIDHCRPVRHAFQMDQANKKVGFRPLLLPVLSIEYTRLRLAQVE